MDQSEVATEMVQIFPLLMRKIHAEIRSHGENMVSAHFRLLSVLGKKPRTMTELAEIQAVSPATISNSVATLVEKGWVKRVPSSEDRRIIRVEITDPGKDKLEEYCVHLHNCIQRSLNGLTETELTQIGAGLKILHTLMVKEMNIPHAHPQDFE